MHKVFYACICMYLSQRSILFQITRTNISITGVALPWFAKQLLDYSKYNCRAQLMNPHCFTHTSQVYVAAIRSYILLQQDTPS